MPSIWSNLAKWLYRSTGLAADTLGQLRVDLREEQLPVDLVGDYHFVFLLTEGSLDLDLRQPGLPARLGCSASFPTRGLPCCCPGK